MKLTKLFIGGHQELKRPVNVTNDALLQRIEEAGRRLRSDGRQIPAVIGPKAAGRVRRPEPDVISLLGDTTQNAAIAARIAEWPGIDASNDQWPVLAATTESAVETPVDRVSNG